MVLAVETNNLLKNYNGVEALKGVNIDIEEGEFFGLLGPNGAGKTTFISILVGLVNKTGGSAEVFGYDVERDYQEVRDLVGLAPQEPDIDRFFPIKKVLMHKAGYHEIPSRVAERRAEELLEKFGILDKKNEPVHKLSGGMKRRLLLARSLINEPELLILDEPTAGVDVELRRELWNVMQEMNEEGRTILLTTHYIEESEKLCERVTILDEGEVIATDTPRELMKSGIDTVEIELAERMEDLEIETVGIESLSWEANKLVIKSRGGTRKVPTLVKELTDKGAEIMDVETRRSSLEDIFVDLTGD